MTSPGAVPVFFINMADRPERRSFIEGQLTGVELTATRVEAVTMADLTAEDLARYCDRAAPNYITPSEAACAMSHVRCWRSFLDLKGASEWALILEDDGVLSRSLPGFLEEFPAAAEKLAVDIVQLETRHRAVRVLPPRAVLPSGHRLAAFRSARDGSACYLISRRAIEALLPRADLFHQPIDYALFRPFTGPGRDIRAMLIDPALCIQLNEAGNRSASAHSDIAPSRRVHDAAGGRWLQRAYPRILNAIDHLAHLPRGLRRRIIAFDGDEARWT